MKRFEITKHYNNMYLLPALYINYERGWYMYVCLAWFKWQLEYRVYNNEAKDL